MSSAATWRRATRARAPLTAVWVGAGESGWLAERALHADGVRAGPHGISLDLDGSFGEPAWTRKLMGRFNAENSRDGPRLPAVARACLLQMRRRRWRAAPRRPGRMEVIEGRRRAASPSRWSTMRTRPMRWRRRSARLREHCGGALWCVFGCGGDRDPGKRPMMGAIADELADQIIVTDDNPRSENPAAHHPRPSSSGIKRARGARRSTTAARPSRAALREAQRQRRGADRGQGPRGLPDLRRRRGAASATGARRCAIWGRRHEAHLAGCRASARAAQLIGEDRPLRRGRRPTAAR